MPLDTNRISWRDATLKSCVLALKQSYSSVGWLSEPCHLKQATGKDGVGLRRWKRRNCW